MINESSAITDHLLDVTYSLRFAAEDWIHVHASNVIVLLHDVEDWQRWLSWCNIDATADNEQVIEAVEEDQRPDMSAVDVVRPVTTSVKDFIPECWAQERDHRPTSAGKHRTILNVHCMIVDSVWESYSVK